MCDNLHNYLVDTVQKLMFPNYDNGRFSVMDDGTLVIESVQKEDAGEYVCKGLSIAGSAYAKARLTVRGTC
jgi:Immunoglobulin I-set domain